MMFDSTIVKKPSHVEVCNTRPSKQYENEDNFLNCHRYITLRMTQKKDYIPPASLDPPAEQE
jgi:hypothetical protein